MIGALFLNPGFLFIGGALISVPIIIHLINRMRFKRIRWAAMEFLLKAQKRTRRRLIIEQFLLLALRCLLILLVGLLVSRFVGCSNANLTGKPNLHLVLVDDTLSMQDQFKTGDEAARTCFDTAKSEILLKKIAKGLSLSKTNDKLILLPLSKVHEKETPKPYERLSDITQLEALQRDITEMQPSMLHVPMLDGIKVAEKIMGNNPESIVTLHIVGDFRQRDWGLPASEGLNKELLELSKKNRDLKIRLIDAVLPLRSASQGGYPSASDNVGIVDIRPGTRIVGKNMPVLFTVSIANFSGKQVEGKLTVRDEAKGKDMEDVDFNPQNPIKLAPDTVSQITFERRFNPEIKAGESHFAHLSVRLTNPQLQPLENDGLLADNLRYTVVEVRDKVPVLIIDGDGSRGLEEGKDSFFIDRVLQSVAGKSYDVIFGDLKSLERADLHKFPTIFLLNVGTLGQPPAGNLNATPKQVTNLENFVREGGGVAFYLGKNVSKDYYNQFLYKDGKGVFPAPLKDMFPGPLEDALPDKAGDTFQLLIRDEKFKDLRSVPIFGAMFEEPKHREPFRNLPIGRYFQVNRSAWKQEPGRVFELATLPNDESILAYQQTVLDITRGNLMTGILANPEFTRYQASIRRHLQQMERLVAPGSEFKAFHLANEIELLLSDKGSLSKKDVFPDLTEFWANSDPRVQALRQELSNLREQVNYGDPFIIAGNFGKGKVVAVMSTAGQDWNKWGGGSAASILYAPFVLEMQNYLSSQGGEANLLVGSDIPLALDAVQFRGAQLKLVRWFMKTKNERPAEKVALGDPLFADEDGGQIHFKMTKHLTPGLYISEVVDGNAPEKRPITVYAHTFNVDTLREGPLQRAGSDELERELVSKSDGAIKILGPGVQDSDIIGRVNDFSESPWLFLILLLVLVAEQALAVHLSFHLKGNEEMTPAVRTPAQAA